MPNLLTFLDLIDINRIAFVHGANFRRGVANDTEPRLCFAQKHSLRGELALFYRRNRGGEGVKNSHGWKPDRRTPSGAAEL